MFGLDDLFMAATTISSLASAGSKVKGMFDKKGGASVDGGIPLGGGDNRDRKSIMDMVTAGPNMPQPITPAPTPGASPGISSMGKPYTIPPPADYISGSKGFGSTGNPFTVPAGSSSTVTGQAGGS